MNWVGPAAGRSGGHVLFSALVQSDLAYVICMFVTWWRRRRRSKSTSDAALIQSFISVLPSTREIYYRALSIGGEITRAPERLDPHLPVSLRPA